MWVYLGLILAFLAVAQAHDYHDDRSKVLNRCDVEVLTAWCWYQVRLKWMRKILKMYECLRTHCYSWDPRESSKAVPEDRSCHLPGRSWMLNMQRSGDIFERALRIPRSQRYFCCETSVISSLYHLSPCEKSVLVLFVCKNLCSTMSLDSKSLFGMEKVVWNAVSPQHLRLCLYIEYEQSNTHSQCHLHRTRTTLKARD